jgi:hypothetical protein
VILTAVSTADVGGEVIFVHKAAEGVSDSEAASGNDISWMAGSSEVVPRGDIVVKELGRAWREGTTAGASEEVFGCNVVAKGSGGVAGVRNGWLGLVRCMDAGAVGT